MPKQHITPAELDLDLLRLFDSLFRLRSVTKAGEELELSQSGASRALGRLRDAMGDPLFIPSAEGLLSTPRADELHEPIVDILTRIDSLRVVAPFDPSTAQGKVQIVMPDHLALIACPNILRQLDAEAPHLEFVVRGFSGEWKEQVLQGEVDMAFGVPQRDELNLRQRNVIDDPWVTIVRKGHPIGKRRLTLRRFLALDHGMMTVTGHGPGFVDRALQARGLSRRVTFRANSPLVAAMMVSETDLAVTTTRLLARTLARHLPLRILKLPLPVESLNLPLLWHERLHYDPLHQWMRRLVVQALETAADCS